MDRVRISVGVPEVDAPLIDPGDPAEVRLQALDGRVFPARVSRLSWALDPSTRTLRAEIDLENPDGRLRPGLYAYVAILADERTAAPSLPASAVLRDGGKAYCVVVSGGQAHRREVVTGLADGRRVEVLSGLEGGEAVVEKNADTLADGQPVEAAAAPEAKK
jgi:RND family efflux transporter MFP subunit